MGMWSMDAKAGAASGWAELQSLVQSAGVTVEQAIGIKSQEPDCSSFQENLVVRGIGEQPLRFQFSAPSELDVARDAGCESIDEPVLLPPFVCLQYLLQPEYVHIPSENEEDVLPSEQDLKPQGLSMETDERASQGSVEQRSPSPTTVEDETAVQVLHSAPQQTRKRKRQLEEKCSSDSDVIDLTQD